MCISHSLDARVAALRAAVGCGRMYRRNAAWAWHAMPICVFRRSCTLPCTPCTLSCTPFLAIVCSLNPDLSGVLGLVHTMHTIFQVLYMAKIYTSLAYIYMSLKKGVHGVQGGKKASGKPMNTRNRLHTMTYFWCAAKCAWRAEGVQRTSEWHPFSLAYFFCLRLFRGCERTFLN